MANSDPDLKWLIITASCQRVAEVNLSVYWTREIVLLEWPVRTTGHRATSEERGGEKKWSDVREGSEEV